MTSAAEGAAAKLSQAIALHERGELQQAAALYLELIDADPLNFDALHMLGVYALQVGDLQAAADLIAQALQVDPLSAPAHVHLATVLQNQGQLDAALLNYQRALDIGPENIHALSNCGGLLAQELKRPADALPLLERAFALAPDHADTLNNLAYALIELRRCEEALPHLQSALRLRPDFAQALYNQGNALQLLNRLAEAMISYDAALVIAPNLVDAHVSQSACRLLMGDLEGGLAQYEWRWRKPAFQPLIQRYAQPLWLGDAPLLGKTLLVHHEQGLGDTLQMSRYIPLLAAQGARVILRVQAPLKTLLAGVEGAHLVLNDDDPLPDFDLHIPLMSLPLAFHTRLDSIPADVPYLHTDAARSAKWQAELAPTTRPRVGLAWAGNPQHDNDRARSIPLAQFNRILTPGIDFISLQREPRAGERQLLDNEPRLQPYPAGQTDFADTAALVAQLDLVICVDTAIAHLAGAMSKPVWLLLPFAPDWRWLIDGDTTPWYPSMRLFRQRRAGDWDEVLERVAEALATLERQPA